MGPVIGERVITDTTNGGWEEDLRKRDDEILRLKEELRALRDTLVDGLIVIDEGKLVRSFNPAAARIFGYEANEVVGQNVRMLMPEPYRQNHDAYVDNYRRTGNAKIIGIGREVSGLRKDGSTFPMDLAVGEMVLADGRYFVGIIRDLTEQKKVDAQLRQSQKMEAIGQLTGGIAHDFNNQLTVLLMDLEALDELATNDRSQRELIEEARGAAQSATDLTQQLLAFSRHKPLEDKVLNIGTIVTSMRGLIRRAIGETIKLDVAVATETWNTEVDPNRFENALLNMVINSRDAMPEGGRLSIEVKNASLDEDYSSTQVNVASGDYVCLSVTDNGMGMDPEVVDRAIEPFFTTKSEGEGTGMGLAMIYGFVNQSGGHIAIYSEKGFGTTVSLYFPRAHSIVERDEIWPKDEGTLDGGSVLLVEDHPQLRKRAKQILEMLGYTVNEAAEPAVALEHLANGAQFDILFTDIVMPGMNGYQLADRAREILPELKVVFASGYSDHNSLNGKTNDDPSNWSVWLQKPYSRDKLANALRELTGRDR